jgi:hypothetical protein
MAQRTKPGTGQEPIVEWVGTDLLRFAALGRFAAVLSQRKDGGVGAFAHHVHLETIHETSKIDQLQYECHDNTQARTTRTATADSVCNLKTRECKQIGVQNHWHHRDHNKQQQPSVCETQNEQTQRIRRRRAQPQHAPSRTVSSLAYMRVTRLRLLLKSSVARCLWRQRNADEK